MATLVSPGVDITVSDESFYAPAGNGTVPLIVIATAQDKTAPDGSGTAAYTTAAEADKVKLITSQRELLQNYGNPSFASSGGTQLHGSEINEYGLLAAYSFLGIANRAYVLRADVDLAELVASATAPTSPPADAEYWFDTLTTDLGIKQWDGTAWVKITPLVPEQGDVTSSPPVPISSYGRTGDYAVCYEDETGVTATRWCISEKIDATTWAIIGSTAWKDTATRELLFGTHATIPTTRAAAGALVAGNDAFFQYNATNDGTTTSIKLYDAATGIFTTITPYFEDSAANAYDYYDTLGGVVEGDLWVDSDADTDNAEALVACFAVKRHNGLATLTAASTSALTDTEISNAAHTGGAVAFNIQVNNGAAGNDVANVVFVETTVDGNISVDEMVGAISTALDSNVAFDNVTVTNNSGVITLVESTGRDLLLTAGNVANFGPANLNLSTDIYTNWDSVAPTGSFVLTAQSTEITGTTAEGLLWYDSTVSNTNIDLLVQTAGAWANYSTVGDVNISASEPTTQADGSTPLASGDIWIDSSDLENYPVMWKHDGTNFVSIDTTDQITSDGIVFADFRQASGASLDADAPNPALYPAGTIGWNKRASGGNVKSWNATTEVWDDASGNKNDGSPLMLRKAQRQVIVTAMAGVITANQDIRNEINRFNLVAAPGYVEVADELISLGIDRKETVFSVIDSPMRLAADATSTAAWATNANNAGENGEDGLIASSEYAAVYYPSGLSTNLDGSSVMVPSSHMALRTIAYNDNVAFPWFAPAGDQRGVVNNASSTGYLDATTGEFTPVALSQGQRDGLYVNAVNPIANFPGRGIRVWGQKTLSGSSSALDRINVARLVVYIREQLDDVVRPFLFQPNDEITRSNAKTIVDRFLGELVSQRGLVDFIVVCDDTNNTQARIDRNELYIDIAIQPVKAVEFIYIPIRVQNNLGQTN
jgi:hypothetical protein